MLSIGIDFGTTNSSVAVFDGRAVRLLELDAAAPDPRVMRSLLYITREGEVITGHRALDAYTRQNTGREVKLERRLVGEIDMVFSDMSLHRHVFGMVDANEPGRLFQSLKRFLADTAFQSTDVFGRQYTIEELLGTLAQEMLASAEKALGGSIDEVVVGRPVRFAADAEKDRAARERLAAAWRLAGVDRVRFLEEPVAAVHHFAASTHVREESRIVVFDFGGGTLDITVAELRNGSVEVLATGGIPLGGDLLDSRMVEAEVAPWFGERARYRRSGLPAPAHLFTKLRTWQTIVDLNRPDLLDLIRKAAHGTDQPDRFAAFEALVTRNYGFELFRAVEAGKIGLSSRDRAEVVLRKDEIDLHISINRADWEAIIHPQVKEASQVVSATLESARCAPEDVSFVVTTGGSSLVPAFREMLCRLLPNASLREADTFTSVAAGLALSADRDKGARSDYDSCP